MPAIGKIRVRKTKTHLIVSDESGQSYTLPRSTGRPLLLDIDPRIAIEAAAVPAIYGYGDPGDCFLIATARIRKLTLVTRDTRIIALAKREPAYLTVMAS